MSVIASVIASDGCLLLPLLLNKIGNVELVNETQPIIMKQTWVCDLYNGSVSVTYFRYISIRDVGYRSIHGYNIFV